MRTYGAIQTQFWTHMDVQTISDKSKLLATYLLTSSHTTMVGCFRIPIGYIAEDLKWKDEQVLESLAELQKINFIMRDEKTGWIIIDNFLKYHPIENPNQGKCVATLFEKIPKNLLFVKQLATKLLKHGNHFQESFRKHLQTLVQALPNQEQNQDQKQEQENEEIAALCRHNASLLINCVSQTQKQDSLRVEAEEILSFLSEKAERKFEDEERCINLIKARLKSGSTRKNCFQIIAKKTREWKTDEKMKAFLRPSTIFSKNNFSKYLMELSSPVEGAAYDR